MKILRIVLSLAFVLAAAVWMWREVSGVEFCKYTVTVGGAGAEASASQPLAELAGMFRAQGKSKDLQIEEDQGQLLIFGTSSDEEKWNGVVSQWNAKVQRVQSQAETMAALEQKKSTLRLAGLQREREFLKTWLAELEKSSSETVVPAPAASPTGAELAGLPWGQALERKSQRVITPVASEEAARPATQPEIFSPVVASLMESARKADPGLQLRKIQGVVVEQAAGLEQIINENADLLNANHDAKLQAGLRWLHEQNASQLSALSANIGGQVNSHLAWSKAQQQKWVQYLQHQLDQAERETTELQSISAPTEPASVPMLATLKRESVSPQAAQLIPGYKILLLGFVACFLFNIFWEMVTQRRGV